MRKLLPFLIVYFGVITSTFAQLPKELWQYANTNTYMFLENDVQNNTHFQIQTNHHFLRFNYQDFKLEQLRLIDDNEVNGKYLEKAQDETLDILSLYVVKNGQKHKVVRLDEDAHYAGEVIESGKFFQRRNFPDLKLEDDPNLKFSVEISSWTDALDFRLVFENDTILSDDYQLMIELDLPSDQVALSKKGEVIHAKAKNGKVWEIIKRENDQLMITPENKIQATTSIKNKEVNLLMRFKYENLHQEGLNIIAKDLHRPNREVVITEAEQQQAKKISLNDSFDGLKGMERVALTLENLTNQPQLQRLIFERVDGVRDITGISVMLRDKDGNPTGIPIQISKNWHNGKEFKYRGPWMRSYTVVCLPPNSKVELELSKVSGYWGTLPAVSHNQLSLTGWGKKFRGNHQLWDQTAMGAWGESVCYEPDCGQANTLITDVRPFMIKAEDDNPIGPKKYNWTPNVGGGDFMRVYDENGQKLKIKRIKSHYKRNCPNLTEVTYTGVTSKDEVDYSLTASIIRNDDYFRGIYTLEIEVNDTFDFHRLALAQFGSETYSYQVENKIAWGNADGLIKEVPNVHKEKQYTNQDIIIDGKQPWFSMHEAKNMESHKYAVTGNKGIVLKEWSATVDGKEIQPRFSTYSSSKTRAGEPVTLVEVNLPSDIKQLKKGDKVRLVMELCVFPQEAKSYYGSNEAFAKALNLGQDTWKLMWREAKKNDVSVNVSKGEVVRNYPLKIKAVDNEVLADLSNGLAYVPVTISNLSNYKDFKVSFTVDDKAVEFNQENHGKDYYQVDFDPITQTWEVTFSIPMDAEVLDQK